ncbi:MAG: histidinol-phosphate transaminase [Candidatus Bathyarchaeia archaeon]
MKKEEILREEVLKVPVYKTEDLLYRMMERKAVKLDLNENLGIEENFLRELLVSAFEDVDVRLYPPPHGMLAVRAISKFYGFSEDMVAVGNGSDELLDSIAKTFVRKESNVLIVEPTFPIYEFAVKLYGGNTIKIFLEPNFELNVEKILEWNGKASLLFLCSPNNPTGNQFRKEYVKALLEGFDGLIVVDEAYVEFAKYSVSEWTKNFDNVIVLRTFSKAFGLAGIRAGFAVSNPPIIKYLRRVVHPFHLNTLTQKIVASALQNWKYFKEKIDYIVKEREWLFKELKAIEGVTPYPSDANFILFRIAKKGLASSAVARKLLDRKIFVKDRGMFPLLENCIRVTVGTREMNRIFIDNLREVLKE